VAELTLALLFVASRHLSWSDSRLKHQEWQRRVGSELGGRTLGVVGLGAIGRTVVELAAGVGMHVLGYDLVTPVGWSPPPAFEQVPLSRLLSESDLVTLHVPGGQHPLVDKDVIHEMRPGTVLVNTARAGLVDEEAVMSALDEGRLSAYAVDAHAEEPPSDWRLIQHDRVIATPHIGGLTDQSVQRAADAAITAILEELDD
jgi:phosphoglycerate dehydrogenase-like enzyme